MASALKIQTVTKALKNGAGDVSTDPIATGEDGGELCYPHEFVISCPALTTAILGDGATMTYKVEHSDSYSADFVTLIPAIALQTGASGAGAAAITRRFRLPSDVKKYVRITATNSASGNASTKSVSLTFYM